MRNSEGYKSWKVGNIPLANSLRGYTKMDATADFISGITIGLIIIPQSIAYVSLIGISPKIGLMSSVIGGLVYSVFGTIKEISIGPTAMMSLLTNEYMQSSDIYYVGFLTFSCACFALLASFLPTGIIVEFVSIPVTAAFSTSVALIIIGSEMRNLLGLKYNTRGFVDSILQLIKNIDKTRIPDFIVAVTSIILLLLLQKLKTMKSYKSRKNRFNSKIYMVMWLIGKSRSAIIIVIGCLVTRQYELYNTQVPYLLTNMVPSGFPTMHSPLDGNFTSVLSEQIPNFGAGIGAIPLVALLVHVSIAKSFGSERSLNVGYELFSISLSYFISSLYDSSPIAGAFTRSAVSHSCGVKTPLSNLYTVILAFFALTLLTPYFGLIPRATLSAVIVTAVAVVIQFPTALTLFKSSRKDFFVFSVTLFVCLFYGIQYGLLVGPLINLLFILSPWARPVVDIKKHQNEYGDYVVITPHIGLVYPGVDNIHSKIVDSLSVDEYCDLPVGINCYFLRTFDYTALATFDRLTRSLRDRKHEVIFFNVPKFVFDMYDKTKFTIPLKAGNLNYEEMNEFFLNRSKLKNGTTCRHLKNSIVKINPQRKESSIPLL